MKKFEQTEPVFVPAKPGEKAPKGVWVPNRKERRFMKKHETKIEGLLTAKEAMQNKNFKQSLYKDLLENLKKKQEEMEKNNERTTEGNQDLESK